MVPFTVRMNKTDIVLISNYHKKDVYYFSYTPWINNSSTRTYFYSISNILILIYLQLSELEHRVVEAETRAEDAEDKVSTQIVI